MPAQKRTFNAPSVYIASPEIIEKLRKEGQIGKPAFEPNPAQVPVLNCRSMEIMATGEKGSGKSALSIMWLLQGNPHWPVIDKAGRTHPTNHSYVNNPKYTALILRKNQQDLKDWLNHARRFYEKMGAVYLDQKGQFQWPSGAVFYTGHLADASAWQKYLGQELHRIVIEEVVTIADLVDYMLLRTCNRSSVPLIRPQILCTCNPFGPGVPWLNARFRHTPEGKFVPPGEEQVEEVWDEEQKKTLKVTRTWFHLKLSDNPYQNTAEYRATLRTGPEHLVRAYAMGDWDAATGSYFKHFRPRGPIGNEPLEARHVRPATELEKAFPWERRIIGADWGYEHNAAGVLIRHAQNGRVIVENSFSQAGLSCAEFGQMLAEMVRKDLPYLDLPLVVALGRDAWARESEVESEAHRIAKGIGRVIGPDRIWLEDETEWERDRLNEGGQIQIRRAYNARVQGWTQLSELMTFIPFKTEGDALTFSAEEALRIRREAGDLSERRYREAWRKSLPETLPKFIIADRVENRKLIQALEKAQHDGKGAGDIPKTHWEGADLADALRYAVMAHEIGAIDVSPKTQRRERLAELLDIVKMNPTPENKEAVSTYWRWMQAREQEEKVKVRHDLGALIYAPLSRRIRMRK